MKAEGFNWYGESEEDDEEDSQQAEVSKQEQGPSDLASILKGETEDDEPKSRSIAEILGISKAEDEDSEPSTFDKIIGRTLEEDTEETAESEPTQPEAEAAAEEDSEASDSSEITIDNQTAEADNLDEEIPLTDARATETVNNDNWHEQPLAEHSTPEPKASAETDEPDDNSSSENPPARGQTFETPSAAPDFSEKPETVAPESPPDQSEAETASAEASPASASEEAPAEEPAPDAATEEAPSSELAEENQLKAEYEPDQTQELVKPDDSKPEEVPSENQEKAEAARRQLKEVMGDEGAEDEQPPPKTPKTAAQGNFEENDPLQTNNRSSEQLPQENKESAVGMLALLLGVREIFKRRKGDRENRLDQIEGDKQNQQAIEQHEAENALTEQELKARQQQAEEEIARLKRGPSNSYPASLEETGDAEILARETENQSNATELNQHLSYEEKLERTNQAYSENPLAYTPEYDESGAEIKTGEATEELQFNRSQNIEELRGLNQEIDGELALDSRQENPLQNKIPQDSVLPGESNQNQPVSLSEVLSRSEYYQDSNIATAEPSSVKSSWKARFQDEDFKTSIKAGVTTGLIIVALASLFFLLK